MLTRRILRELSPPLLWRIFGSLKSISPQPSKWSYGAEQPPEFYNEHFFKAAHLQGHYTQSPYYPLWTVIADRLQRAQAKKVLDIGCGPGQVACLLHDKGIPEYLGIDFSSAQIEQALKVCPDYNFITADIFNTDLLQTYSYDCVLTTEFLEHVEQEIDVLTQIKPGTFILATVPNFTAPGHVRYFDSKEKVYERYEQYFDSFRVDEHLADFDITKFYILEGFAKKNT